MRWGILGVAGINESFVPGLLAADGAEAVAIASRSPERAREQAERWGIPRAYGAYDDLLADDGVDVVVGEHVRVGAIRPRDAPAVRLLARALERAARDRGGL